MKFTKDGVLEVNIKCMLMGEGGLEPPTSSLSGMRSNQLSYTPIGLFCKN